MKSVRMLIDITNHVGENYQQVNHNILYCVTASNDSNSRKANGREQEFTKNKTNHTENFTIQINE